MEGVVMAVVEPLVDREDNTIASSNPTYMRQISDIFNFN